MEIAIMIICCLVSIIANFFSAALASIWALKITSKTLVSVIEECEKADKSALFMEKWKEHNK